MTLRMGVFFAGCGGDAQGSAAVRTPKQAEEMQAVLWTPPEHKKCGRPRPTHCRECGKKLTAKSAYKRADSDAFRNICRKCYAVKRRARHDRAEERRRHELGKTHLTCDVCGSEETVTRGGKVRLPAIDHDHETGQIRGVLCSRCNAAIGLFRDDPALLTAAAGYLVKAAASSAEHHLGPPIAEAAA